MKKQGFTLVELILSIVLVSIIIVTMVGTLLKIRQSYSIINQTFPYWEWIIINDGSTQEGTEQILSEIASLDNRIKVFNETNHGRIITRGAGRGARRPPPDTVKRSCTS